MPLLPDGTTFDVSVLVGLPAVKAMDKLDCWWGTCYPPLAIHLTKNFENRVAGLIARLAFCAAPDLAVGSKYLRG